MTAGATRQRGQAGEDLACAHLSERGLRILARNFRCRVGEIDVIAQDGDTTVFVEVKERTGASHGAAVEAVTAGKRRRLVRSARVYAAQNGLSESALRFDVVAIDWGVDGPRIRHELARTLEAASALGPPPAPVDAAPWNVGEWWLRIVMTRGAGEIGLDPALAVDPRAIVMALPIPGANPPPAIACALIAIGILERDGVVVALGIAAGIAALAFASSILYGFFFVASAVTG